VFRADWDSDQAPNHLGAIVVFSHVCDTPKSPTSMIAKIEPESTTDPGTMGHIRSGRVWHAYHLAGCADPGWVNLRTIQPVPNDLMLQRLDRRIHSMSPDGQVALAMAAFAFFTHSKPPAAILAALLGGTPPS
jgi:hypothetical protein